MTSPFVVVAFAILGYAVGDEEHRINSGNQTTVFIWTLDSVDDHIVHCLATGNPLPSLKWAYGSNREEFLGNETILVDTKNQSDIVMTFKKIDYHSINEFYCMGYDPKNKSIIISEATIDILVTQHKSNWIILWWLLFLTIFMVAAVWICRWLKFNDYAVEMDK